MTTEAMIERHDEVSQIRILGQTAPRRPAHEACASRRLEAPPSSVPSKNLVRDHGDMAGLDFVQLLVPFGGD